MRLAAYCRVSTEKEDQLNSLETQIEFFKEYAKEKNYTLVQIYVDEGISGTKLKKRADFMRMIADAEKGIYDVVAVKDISRFSRNTVDTLEAIRKLKSLGIPVNFVNTSLSSLGDGEFVITVFGAMAQEESANMSKRVKFGKNANAKKGRVPNITFGYDKIPNDYFNLNINEDEARMVRQIFEWYTEEGYGALKISKMLNDRKIATKRGCTWTQKAVCRIITNKIYIGEIINHKQEVTDFLTSARRDLDESEWYIIKKPELQIVDRKVFDKAQELLAERFDTFKMTKERHSNKYLFSTLIKCAECGHSFRRVEKTYKNTYVRWVCSYRNGKGADKCSNETVIDEKDLIQFVQDEFTRILGSKKETLEYIKKRFTSIYKAKDKKANTEKDLKNRIAKIDKTRQKYMDMYTDDLISREELNNKISSMKVEKERLEKDLYLLTANISREKQLTSIINDTFKALEDFTDLQAMTNAQIRQIIEKIVVSNTGEVVIYFKFLEELGIDQTVLISDNYT